MAQVFRRSVHPYIVVLLYVYVGCEIFAIMHHVSISIVSLLFLPRIRPYEQVAVPKAEKDWETSSVASSGYGTDRESGGSRKRGYEDDRSSHPSKYRRDDSSSNLSRYLKAALAIARKDALGLKRWEKD